MARTWLLEDDGSELGDVWCHSHSFLMNLKTDESCSADISNIDREEVYRRDDIRGDLRDFFWEDFRELESALRLPGPPK